MFHISARSFKYLVLEKGSKYLATTCYYIILKQLNNIFLLDNSGLSSSHFAWAFHSVAEEELIKTLPAMQKGDPTWSELRAMGVGWWVRNAHSLRRCIEKVNSVYIKLTTYNHSAILILPL